MVPPHIAAGVNLNLPVIGPILRRGGAFFMRRSFKANALYSAVFTEYVSQLVGEGFSLEYFIEGGRSRTGRLLAPERRHDRDDRQGLSCARRAGRWCSSRCTSATRS